MPAVGRPLNLLALARGAPGRRQAVPGGSLEVVAVDDAGPADGVAGRWVLLLAGDLLVDLPYGDFRHLAPGDRLALPSGIDVGYKPLEPSVLLLGPLAG